MPLTVACIASNRLKPSRLFLRVILNLQYCRIWWANVVSSNYFCHFISVSFNISWSTSSIQLTTMSFYLADDAREEILFLVDIGFLYHDRQLSGTLSVSVRSLSERYNSAEGREQEPKEGHLSLATPVTCSPALPAPFIGSFIWFYSCMIIDISTGLI